jgi:type VI secretion system protein ImpE
MTDLPSLLRAGRLDDARAAAAAVVRARPADAGARIDLADILIVLGELERADTHLDLAGTQDPSRAVAVALTRQLIRAARWRRETWDERRPPELVTEPDAAIAASLARLAGADAAADPPELAGIVDDAPFTGLRDLDDRTAGVLEVLTSTGKYVWVPLARIASLRPARPERLRDLVWRRAELDVAGGPGGVVYLPAIYHAASGMTDAHRLGRATDWIEEPGHVHGLGQRILLIGDEPRALDEITDLQVTG